MDYLLYGSCYLQRLYVFGLLIHLGWGFYLPGLAPVNYCTSELLTDECKVSWTSGFVMFKVWVTVRACARRVIKLRRFD